MRCSDSEHIESDIPYTFHEARYGAKLGTITISTLESYHAMKKPAFRTTIQALLILVFASQALSQDPLPSWNETAAKKSIVAFVEKVIQVGTSEFVPERWLAFDLMKTVCYSWWTAIKRLFFASLK